MANLVQVGIMYFGKYIQLSICYVLLQHVLRKDLKIYSVSHRTDGKILSVEKQGYIHLDQLV
jgi:hypothetical protein